jgi:uncharacterized protein YndB with AHSA1/START domain
MPALVKIPLMLLAGLLAVILIGIGAGWFMAKDHRITRVVHLKASPERVWLAVSDHASDPKWREDVAATTRLADRNGHAVWEDRFKKGDQRIAYETTESREGQKLVRTIVDQTAFGGTWTYELAPEGTGTRVAITESGWIAPPLRLPAKLFMNQAATLEAYLGYLAKAMGEDAKPQAD